MTTSGLFLDRPQIVLSSCVRRSREPSNLIDWLAKEKNKRIWRDNSSTTYTCCECKDPHYTNECCRLLRVNVDCRWVLTVVCGIDYWEILKP